MGNSQPPPIEQVEEILDEIDEAIRELHDDAAADGESPVAETPSDDGGP